MTPSAPTAEAFEPPSPRFGAGTRQLPSAIEWLSDNGSIYTSDETRSFVAEIGFKMCTTPPYSPESNGMAESFV